MAKLYVVELGCSAQFLDGVRVKWLGEAVVVDSEAEDQKERPIEPQPGDVAEAPKTSAGVDQFLAS